LQELDELAGVGISLLSLGFAGWSTIKFKANSGYKQHALIDRLYVILVGMGLFL